MKKNNSGSYPSSNEARFGVADRNVTITYDNGNMYEGAFHGGAIHGVGKMKYKDGRVRDGIWEKGEIKYEGELNDNGKPHGRGKWMHSGGTWDI